MLRFFRVAYVRARPLGSAADSAHDDERHDRQDGSYPHGSIGSLPGHRATGAAGLVGYLLNSAGLAGAFAIEYTLHHVFPPLGGTTIDGLLSGGTGRAFLVTSVVLIAGVLAFGVAAPRSGALPAVAIALYAVGMIPGSLRNPVPVPVYLAGLVIAAVGIAWMSARLWAAREESAPLQASGA
ncbi:hypothetical protein [Streptosporangium sp. V21-05]|uniref:hypothetical protein n=1 Tax=Streptosporangium sp. V21-05 TaxID=3446115 RepID=UPI003F52E3AC